VITVNKEYDNGSSHSIPHQIDDFGSELASIDPLPSHSYTKQLISLSWHT